MTVGLLLIFVIVFMLADLAIRTILRRVHEQQRQRERETALAESLKLDFTREARSLKRVEVKDPVARILCVDDEDIILDSFRRILVLDGYSVDTVTGGREALGLIQTHHYDFVFTDLRMPEMDGVEVVKAVKHMRPDIDVVIITGFATVETAVECMKYGAADYVQKPFTEAELRAFVKKALIKRQDRIQKQLRPRIHVTSTLEPGAAPSGEFAIPGGVFISPGHCWASLSPDGHVRIGLDDFARKVVGRVDGVEFPNIGMTVRAGQPLFAIRQEGRRVQFHAPVGGQVVKVNQSLLSDPELFKETPYHNQWICTIDGDHLDSDLAALKIGKAAVALFQEDITRFVAFMREDAAAAATGSAPEEAVCVGAMEKLSQDRWDQAAKTFFGA